MNTLPPGSSMTDALLERARVLVPGLRARGAVFAEARRIPDEDMERVASAGLMGLLRPRRYGGAEVGMDVLYDITHELARGDGSMAWVYIVISAHDLLIAHFPAEVQEEYWASPLPQCASSYAPFGKAAPAQGGYRLTGKWSYCSGIDFVGWIVVGAIVGMRSDEPKVPDLRFFLLPTSQLKVIDDWHAMGLSGTGSKSVALEDVFVPAHRILTAAQVFTGESPGREVHSNPLLRAPVWAMITFALGIPAAGIALGAYETLLDEFRTRVTTKDPVFHAKLPAVQMHLAEASALIRAAELLIFNAVKDTYAGVRAGHVIPVAQRVANRRDTTYSISMARRASEILLSMAGARGLDRGSNVQRAVRDIYASSVHPGTTFDAAALSFGSHALGTGVTDPFY
jgi:alkylation response protein AidB-like acyl-CoA dehydrogenase